MSWQKTGYFNTGFVSLQYKNTNRYWSKCNNKIAENHKKNLQIIFSRAGPMFQPKTNNELVL